MMNSQPARGFTLIEIMVSMVIGLFLLAGVFTIYLSSAKTQQVVENDVKMMGDARFAIQSIAYDLRHSGGYGHQNHESMTSVFDEEKFTKIADQCGGDTSGWAVNLSKPVYAVNNGTDYKPGCMSNYSQGDSLELRYASALPVGTAESDLVGSMLYLKSVSNYSYMFKGSTPPADYLFQKSDGSEDPNVRYFIWQSRGYYVSDFTDSEGDGVPSLRLVTLEPGVDDPIVKDSVLLRGVEDLQIQFGLDTPPPGEEQGDGSVNTYVNPDVVINRWNQVVAVRIWIVLRSEDTIEEVNADAKYTVAGVEKTNGDKYKRTVVSMTVRLRNTNTGG